MMVGSFVSKQRTTHHKPMNLCVIGGSGYVGFITGLGFAELGNDVINVDIDRDKVKMMNDGKSPIYEEDIDLNEVLKRNLDSERIEFTTDLETGVKNAEVIFIAVGTPEKENGEADLSQVIGVAEDLLEYIDDYKVIVIKSTVPVGTIDLFCSILKREKTEGKDFDIVANPEFLREGKGIYDFFHPKRIILGTHSDRAKQVMHNLYAPFTSTKSSNFQRNKRTNAKNATKHNEPYKPNTKPLTLDFGHWTLDTGLWTRMSLSLRRTSAPPK